MRVFFALSVLMIASASVRGDAGVASAEMDEIQDSNIDIDVDRLGVLDEKTAEIWRKLRADSPRSERKDLRLLNHNLRSTVWEINQLRENLCNDRFMVRESCVAPYLPKWVLDPRSEAKTLAELEARQSELSDHVETLWNAACVRLKRTMSDEDAMEYCSIE